MIAQPIEKDAVYSIGETAMLLKVSDTIIYYEIKMNRLQAARVGRGRGQFRVLGDDILKYLKSQQKAS